MSLNKKIKRTQKAAPLIKSLAIENMKKYLHFYILIVGIIIFLFGITYGVYFAFPYTDLPPEKAEEYHFDSMVSSVTMVIGFGLIFFGVLFGVVRVLRKYLSQK